MVGILFFEGQEEVERTRGLVLLVAFRKPHADCQLGDLLVVLHLFRLLEQLHTKMHCDRQHMFCTHKLWCWPYLGEACTSARESDMHMNRFAA